MKLAGQTLKLGSIMLGCAKIIVLSLRKPFFGTIKVFWKGMFSFPYTHLNPDFSPHTSTVAYTTIVPTTFRQYSSTQTFSGSSKLQSASRVTQLLELALQPSAPRLAINKFPVLFLARTWDTTNSGNRVTGIFPWGVILILSRRIWLPGNGVEMSDVISIIDIDRRLMGFRGLS